MPPGMSLEQFGFSYTSEGIDVVEEMLPDLYQAPFDERTNSRKAKQELLNMVGDALAWLHERKHAHLQLCPSSIKVTSKFLPKLANIAFSAINLNPINETTNLTDLYFFAPEVLRFMEQRPRLLGCEKRAAYFTCIGEAADVYSFGVLMHWLLVLNRSAPYPMHISETEPMSEHIAQILKDQRRPRIEEEFERNEPEMVDLMQQCWAPWRKRPSMKSLLEALKKLKIQQ
jgi:hypothetical protein